MSLNLVVRLILLRFFIYDEGWAVSRSPRGRHLNFRGVCSQKTRIFTVYSKVPASGVSRRDPPRREDFGRQIFVKKKPSDSVDSVALVREQSLFSTVYRRATAAGTVPRAPRRSTCIDHTRDELRSPYDGRVMNI